MRKLTGVLLWLYVFTVPWDGVVAVPGIGTLTRVVGIIVIGAAVLTVMIEGRLRKPDLIFGVAIAFTAVSALSLLWTISYPATSEAVTSYVQLLGSVWVAREFARTRRQQQLLLIAFCLGAFVPMVGLFDHFRTGAQIGGGRYTATSINANTVASLLVIGIPIAWHLMMTSAGTVRAMMQIYFVLAPVGILLTGTRGGFLAGIVALSIVPVSFPRNSLSTLRRVIVWLFVVAALVAPIVPRSTWIRMGSIASEIMQGGSMSERRELWETGIHQVPDRPLLGVGAGTYGVLLQKAGYVAVPAHNLFIGLLVEQGILGLSVFIALLGACGLAIFRMSPPDRKVWAVLMLAWMVGLMSQSLERWKVTWVLFALLSAQNGLETPFRHVRRSERIRADAA